MKDDADQTELLTGPRRYAWAAAWALAPTAGLLIAMLVEWVIEKL